MVCRKQPVCTGSPVPSDHCIHRGMLYVFFSLFRGNTDELTSQYVGGFMGDWRKAPSGVNCEKKLELLKEEGVRFDEKGMLVNRDSLWAGFKVK